MAEVGSIGNEFEVVNSVEFEQQDPLTQFFLKEVSKLTAELQQIDRELTFVFNFTTLIQAKYTPHSDIPKELHSRVLQSMTQCQNAWQKSMGGKQQNSEAVLKFAREHLNSLILDNKIELLKLQHVQGPFSQEKYIPLGMARVWCNQLRFIIGYIAFSAGNLRQEDWQKIKDIFEKNHTPFSDTFKELALKH